LEKKGEAESDSVVIKRHATDAWSIGHGVQTIWQIPEKLRRAWATLYSATLYAKAVVPV
jgi:hypothetical protein